MNNARRRSGPGYDQPVLRVVTALLIVIAASGVHAEDRVAVVLDLSAGSWNSLPDGTPGFVAARTALAAWMLEIPPDIVVELRTAGGANPAYDLTSCQDSRAPVPLGPVVPIAWRNVLAEIRPAGTRPLLLAVGAAVGDLGTTSERRRIIALTSGEDDCDGEANAVIDALAGGLELRVIGLSLSSEAAERFGSVAPTRNATSPESLLKALRWAVEDLAATPPIEGDLRMTISTLVGLDEARLQHTVTLQEIEPVLVDGTVSATLPPGTYTLYAKGNLIGSVEIHGLQIQAGQTTSAEIALEPPNLVTLEAMPLQSTAGTEMFVTAIGAPAGPSWISLTPVGQPEASWQNRQIIEPGATGTWIGLPDTPGAMELTFHEGLGETLSRIIARVEVEIVAAEALLTAPTEIGTLEEIPVSWTGPANPGDHLSVGRPGSSPTRFASCSLTGRGDPTTLMAPSEEGEWVIRYVTGQSGRILARSLIVVSDVRVVLSSPESVRVGRPFEVEWEGPAGEADYISLAAVGTPTGAYLNLHLAEHGSPAALVAPQDPGDYEVRYVRGTDDSVLRRAPLTVESPPISLSAPTRVKAGTRFDVQWTGPDRSGDFISLAPKDSRPGRKLDWSYTTAGNPLSLAAPFNPGTFEVRYVGSDPLRVLASSLITVDP